MRSRSWALLIALLVLVPTAAAFHQPDKPKNNPNDRGGQHHPVSYTHLTLPTNREV